ncbi:MAG: hypothetical protein IBX70_09945 [Clostridia bacterium]|nr:hypothetical protein [Clostridia bacterium]
MVPKKSIFEKMGLIEPKITEKKEEIIEIETQTENIPDPEHVPDLRNLDFEEQKPIFEESFKSKEEEEEEEPVSTPNEISDKLDLIIGAYEKNKMLTIDEIYRNAHLDSEVKKTIFMTDVYLKAIPENLPLDIKRETVLNIMKVSNIGLDDLLNDAYKRIDSLNTVLEETVATTQEVFDRNDTTIRELEKRIEDLKDVNKNRKKFQEDQNTMIEYEIQKIINLVEFVKPKK